MACIHFGVLYNNLMEDWLKPMLAEKFFDFILYIDIRQNAYRKLCEKNNIPYTLPDQGTYGEFLRGMMSMLCGSTEDFAEDMKLIRILSALECEEKYMVFCRLEIQGLVYDKKIVFLYGAKEETILVFCEDITGIAIVEDMKRQGKESGSAGQAEAERVKMQVAYLAHEIRTLLHSIYGNLSILKRGEYGNDSHLDNAVYTAEHLLCLTNSVLGISMLENDANVINTEAVTLEELILYPGKIVSQPAQEKGIQLQFCFGKPVYQYLYLNKDMIWQIIVNLLSNAIKYTNSGGKVVCRITETYLEEKRVKLLLEVTDTGIGMEEKFLSEAWNAYAREQRMQGSFGSGLGLMFTKRMVELLGGSIDMISRVGLGTKVSVELEADGDDVLYASALSYEDREKALRSPKQVFIKRALVAEDEGSNMEIICRYLEELGVAADRAYNGRQAIEIFEKSKMNYYHIILMDINMPDKDGTEAIRLIRCMDRPDSGLPIIAVTAQIPDKEKKDAFSDKIDGYLVKPYRLEDICSVLLKCQR